MKQVIILFIFALGFVSMSAQSAEAEKNGYRSQYYFYSQLDTISTSSTSHTFQLTPSETFYKNMDCVISITADSLTGGTTATATIQGAAYPGSSNWQTIGSEVTIDGVSTVSRQTVQLVDANIRLNVVAGSSTQTTKVIFELACKVR